MKVDKILFALGAVLILFPILGLPLVWKTNLCFVVGVIVVVISYFLGKKDTKKTKEDDASAQAQNNLSEDADQKD